MRKKALSWILMVSMILSMCITLPLTALALELGFSGGTGTESDPYLISTKEDLEELATNVNGGTSYSGTNFRLISDLDISGEGDASGWIPVGTETNRFEGIFDGDGHVIGGLTIDRADVQFQGLFGYIGTNGVVKNLGLENVNVDCPISSSGGKYIGGIAGLVGGTVTSCYVDTGSVAGYLYVGGITGWINGTVENCYATDLSVSGYGDSMCIGGVAGSVNAGTLTNCYATGTVSSGGTASDYYTGGVAGFVNSTAAVSHSFALGSAVSGNSYVGRVAGYTMAALSYNFANYLMTVNGSTVSSNDPSSIHGSDTSYNTVYTLAASSLVWTNAAFGNFSTEVWTVTDGSYPALKAFEDSGSSTGDGFTVIDGVLTAYTGSDSRVEIPGDRGITSIADSVFADNTGLVSVTVPEGVTAIGDMVFSNCNGII